MRKPKLFSSEDPDDFFDNDNHWYFNKDSNKMDFILKKIILFTQHAQLKDCKEISTGVDITGIVSLKEEAEVSSKIEK